MNFNFQFNFIRILEPGTSRPPWRSATDDFRVQFSDRCRRFLFIALILAGACSFLQAAEQESSPEKLLIEAREKYKTGRIDDTLSLLGRVLSMQPTNTEGLVFRARVHEDKADLEKALADYGKAISLNPKSPDLYYLRGGAHFKAGKMPQSIADFDQFASLRPDQEAQLWQRGIAYYYADRFEEGRKQFDLHQSVNPRDVENAVWHFLCNARLKGFEAARSVLIPISGDSRVPMRQIHRLFAGRADVKEVLDAALAGSPRLREQQLFYAHLYLGLFFEIAGDLKQSRDYIKLAADKSSEHGYMGEVARVHYKLREKSPAPAPAPAPKK